MKAVYSRLIRAVPGQSTLTVKAMSGSLTGARPVSRMKLSRTEMRASRMPGRPLAARLPPSRMQWLWTCSSGFRA